jgi:hypothetical protein
MHKTESEPNSDGFIGQHLKKLREKQQHEEAERLAHE